MRRLFIAEKPNVGAAIAEVMPGAVKQRTHYVAGNDIITWCFGHILEQAMPEDYNPAFKNWSAEHLPIVPSSWKLLPKEESAAQLKAIKELLGQADVIVNAGDADREGQLLVEEVLHYLGNKKPVKRVLITDNNPGPVKQALAAIKDNSDQMFQGWYLSALARSRFDWLFGLNLTRAYTLAARRIGFDGVLSVGRVQTPTLALVVKRDLEIESFQSKPFYTLTAQVKHANGAFAMAWKAKDEQAGLDDAGRLIDAGIAQALAQRLTGKPAVITKYEKATKNDGPPLLFALSTLIKAANNKYGYGAQDVLDTCQSLYEKHKLTTYPRVDCEYASDDHHADAPERLEAIRANRPDLAALVGKADPKRKSNAFNSKKVTAHHAIIPTSRKADLAALSPMEKNVYDMVCRSFLAQFFPAYQYLATAIEADIDGEHFSARGNTPVAQGWREVYTQPADDSDAEPKAAEDDDKQTLPAMQKGDRAAAEKVTVNNRKTTPPPRYTEGTLQDAMKDIHKFVDDPEVKKRLREGQGIGTEATRPGIIEELKKRTFIGPEKAGSKKIVSSKTGRGLILALPRHAKDPALTALCEQALDAVAAGKMTVDDFLARNIGLITKLCKEAETATLKVPVTPQVSCPTCKTGFLKRREGKTGHFWSCTNWSAEPKCEAKFQDVNGKPLTEALPDITCPKCKTGTLRRVPGKNGYFWSCSNYKNEAAKCDASYPDLSGRPNFNPAPRKPAGKGGKSGSKTGIKSILGGRR